MMTAADIWCDTFTYVTTKERRRAPVDPVTGKKPTRPWQAFINISMLIPHKEMMNDLENRVFVPGTGDHKVVDIDGFPHFKVKPRFIESIRRCGNDWPKIMHMLKTFFRSEAIEVMWPDIALTCHNIAALKQNRRELAEYRAAIKKIPRSDRQLHAEVVRLTQNHSVDTFMKERRRLSK